MNINKFDEIKKALEMYLRKIYSELSSTIDTSKKTLDRDLKNVMKSIWVEDDGIIRINYSNMSDDGLDAEIIENYITSFLKKLNIKLIPYNKRTGRNELEDSLKLYKENKMKSEQLKKMIKEELATIKESAVKRWVATIEMYVYGRDENEAKQEANDLIKMIDEQADNRPSLINLKPQEFGKIGDVKEAFGFGKKKEDTVVNIKKNAVILIFALYKKIQNKESKKLELYKILIEHNLDITEGAESLYRKLKSKKETEIIDMMIEIESKFSRYFV